MISKLTKKVFRCPQCSQKLRVPIRPGKVLRVSCHKCHAQFDVSFKSPFLSLFQWEKGRTLKYNLEGLKLRFKAMSISEKMSLFASIFVILLFMNLVFLVVGSVFEGQSKKMQPVLPKSNEHIEVI